MLTMMAFNFFTISSTSILKKNFHIEKMALFDRELFIKRDDKLQLIEGVVGLNGNKARKFFSLLKSKTYNIICSFGGHQSNSMLALAKLSLHFNKRFIYFAKPLPIQLKNKPEGNFFQALNASMEVSLYLKFFI
jgi:1-aminocyclopropane-1-carboxylate deaminase/D-cysteine desulfhydrase-like pyridoxal-dependent ACC family enzyme